MLFNQMKAPMNPSRAVEIWYDGSCPLCRRSRNWCESQDSNGDLRFRDFRTARDEDLPVTREEAESSMWVHDADGSLFSSFDGWRRILAELPRWRWLAALAGLPPVRWFGQPLYRIIARFRNQFAAWL